MYVPRGYRAREAAAKLRNNRKLVSEDIRAARYSVLPDNFDQAEAEVEVLVTDETTNSTPAASDETVMEVETPAAEAGAEGDAKPAAEVADASKEEAAKAEEPKPKAKHARKAK